MRSLRQVKRELSQIRRNYAKLQRDPEVSQNQPELLNDVHSRMRELEYELSVLQEYDEDEE